MSPGVSPSHPLVRTPMPLVSAVIGSSIDIDEHNLPWGLVRYHHIPVSSLWATGPVPQNGSSLADARLALELQNEEIYHLQSTMGDAQLAASLGDDLALAKALQSTYLQQVDEEREDALLAQQLAHHEENLGMKPQGKISRWRTNDLTPWGHNQRDAGGDSSTSGGALRHRGCFTRSGASTSGPWMPSQVQAHASPLAATAGCPPSPWKSAGGSSGVPYKPGVGLNLPVSADTTRRKPAPRTLSCQDQGPVGSPCTNRSPSAFLPVPASPATAGDKGSGREVGPSKAQEDLEKLYVDTLRPFLLLEKPLLTTGGHHFAHEVQQQKKLAGGELMRRRNKVIAQEIGTLKESRPLARDSSIFVVVDEEHMDVLRACIFPCGSTPYANGAFIFDILLPSEYPDKPPHVQFRTTGGGTVRFNPNLYNCGKVCLSLLGTWSGPSWVPGQSTLLQVLISLQSLVFVEEPYFNEPGYEVNKYTRAGGTQSKQYNRDVRSNTLHWAISKALSSPDPCLREVLYHHYRLKRDEVMMQATKWGNEEIGEVKARADSLVKDYDRWVEAVKPEEVQGEGIEK